MKTIVYLHGLNCSSKIFNHIRSQLPEHNAIALDYNSAGSIEESFASIVDRLPAEPFSIVSHSLGGILGYLLVIRQQELKIEKFVSISTPFGGSKTANKLKWFYPGFKILKDLSTTSSVINEIESTPIVKCKFLSIVSVGGHMPFISEPNDGVVSIESQRSVKSTKTIEVKTNHFEAVQDEKTVDAIRKFIF